jgi:hypothetical protein
MLRQYVTTLYKETHTDIYGRIVLLYCQYHYEEVWPGIMGLTYTMAPQNVDAWRQTFAYSSTAYCLSDCKQFSYRKREIFVSIINFVCQLVDKTSEVYTE